MKLNINVSTVTVYSIYVNEEKKNIGLTSTETKTYVIKKLLLESLFLEL